MMSIKHSQRGQAFHPSAEGADPSPIYTMRNTQLGSPNTTITSPPTLPAPAASTRAPFSLSLSATAKTPTDARSAACRAIADTIYQSVHINDPSDRDGDD
ncbi:MAG: hypothetical protein M1827_004422, partial [Pycnora praestabilis]